MFHFNPWCTVSVDYWGDHFSDYTGVGAKEYFRTVCKAGTNPVTPLPVVNHNEFVSLGASEQGVLVIDEKPTQKDTLGGGTSHGEAYYEMVVPVPDQLLSLLGRQGAVALVLSSRVESNAGTLSKDPAPNFTVDLGLWLQGAVLSGLSVRARGVSGWVASAVVFALMSVAPSAHITVRWDFPSIKDQAAKFRLDLELTGSYHSMFFDAKFAPLPVEHLTEATASCSDVSEDDWVTVT